MVFDKMLSAQYLSIPLLESRQTWNSGYHSRRWPHWCQVKWSKVKVKLLVLILNVKYCLLNILWRFNFFWCLFVCFEFFVPLKNLSLIGRRHHYRWEAANFDLCQALMAIEQWGFLAHLSVRLFKLFTFSSSSQEPLDKFQPNWHKAFLGQGDSSLFKWRASPFS